jgi:hypothetical protein
MGHVRTSQSSASKTNAAPSQLLIQWEGGQWALFPQAREPHTRLKIASSVSSPVLTCNWPSMVVLCNPDPYFGGPGFHSVSGERLMWLTSSNITWYDYLQNSSTVPSAFLPLYTASVCGILATISQCRWIVSHRVSCARFIIGSKMSHLRLLLVPSGNYCVRPLKHVTATSGPF